MIVSSLIGSGINQISTMKRQVNPVVEQIAVEIAFLPRFRARLDKPLWTLTSATAAQEDVEKKTHHYRSISKSVRSHMLLTALWRQRGTRARLRGNHFRERSSCIVLERELHFKARTRKDRPVFYRDCHVLPFYATTPGNPLAGCRGLPGDDRQRGDHQLAVSSGREHDRVVSN